MITVSGRRFWLLFALVFCADVAKHALTFATGAPALELDSGEYWMQAGRAADGDWLQLEKPVDYRTPLYPMFLGALRWALADDALFAAVLAQHGLHVATGLMTAWICWQIAGSRWIALVGYALSVLCLTQSWYANVLLAESLFVFFLTAMVSALVAYHQRPSLTRAAALAALLGVATLVRPVPQLLWLPLFGLFFWRCSNRVEFRQSLRECAVAGGVLLAVFAPWMARNWLIFDEVFLARLPTVNKWQVCFQGGSAARLPIPDTPSGRTLRKLLSGSERGKLPDRYCYAVIGSLQQQGLSDRRIDELISDACASAIREHPLPYFWATFKRFVNFWRCTVREYPFYSNYTAPHTAGGGDPSSWRLEPVASEYEQILRHSPARWLRWNELDSLAALFGTLLLVARRRTRVIGLSLGAMFLYFAAVTAAVELENYRYRLCLQPCMIVAIACGVLGSRDLIAKVSETLRERFAAMRKTV